MKEKIYMLSFFKETGEEEKVISLLIRREEKGE